MGKPPPLIDRPLVSIDLEMTSARPENQEIIEIAAVKFIGDRIVDTLQTLVRPSVPLPMAIQRLTGLSPAELARAPVIDDVAPRLRRFLGDAPLVAHTVASDVGALARQGLEIENDQIDTFELASILIPGLSSYSLAALVRHFDLKHTREHRALPDAEVTRQLFGKLLDAAMALEPAILHEIVALTSQTTWPLRHLFRAIELAQAETTGSGVTIRDQLAAKLGAGEASLDRVLAREHVEPLVPAKDRQAVDVGDAPRVFARGLSGYEERPQQVAMTQAVARAFNDGGQLLVEAGTGVGKSLAYLLPAARFAATNAERVVVSTNTINLQEQLAYKDTGELASGLKEQFRVAVLKGRANYLCFQRWKALRHHAELTLEETLTLIKVLVWLPRTETGDVGELNLTEAERAVWTRLSSHPDVCAPRRCAAVGKQGCFLQYARERAAGAHVVIANHALLLSDVATENKVLPDYRFLVVDEAHHLEEQATNQLGFALRPRDMETYFNSVSSTSEDLGTHFRGSSVGQSTQRQAHLLALAVATAATSARATATGFFESISAFLRTHGQAARGYDQRTRFTRGLRSRSEWTAVEIAWEALALALAQVNTETMKLHALLSTLDDHDVLDYEALVGQIEASLRFNEQLRVRGGALVQGDDVEWVSWSVVAGGEMTLHSAPLHVGEMLRTSLFDQKEAAILTSATLTADNSFDYIKGRLGLPDADSLQVGSPFDYASAALLCLPVDMPEPDQPSYPAALARSLIEVCSATGGRALVLFTAHTQLRQAYFAIRGPLEARGILVLGHGVDGTPRRHLLQSFQSNPRTVLLGAASFWEGIDVIGEGLSLLAIAKLPFPVPTDPVVSARGELMDDSFGEYHLPSTILKLKQGFGRLIRSRTDRGAVICYDRRVLTKGYGPAVLRSLPPAQQERLQLAGLPARVAEWLTPPRRDSAPA